GVDSVPENQKSEYDASQIKKITPHEHVRLRPSLYVGGTDKNALHRLLYNLLYYPLDKAFVNACDVIKITLLPDNVVCIEEQSQTQIDSSREFEYLMEVGTGGPTPPYYCNPFIGATCALSTGMTVELQRDGKIWQRHYAAGEPVTPVEEIRSMNPDEKAGMTYIFQPDFKIMDKNEFDYEHIRETCLEFSYLVPNTTIHLVDERGEIVQQGIFHKPGGLLDWCDDLISERDLHALHHPLFITTEHTLYVSSYRVENQTNHYTPVIRIQVLIQFCKGSIKHIRESASTYLYTEGGTHVDGVLDAINTVIDKNHLEDVALYARVHVLHHSLNFQSLSELKLLDEDIYNFIKTQVIFALKNRWDISNVLDRVHHGKYTE
ncbi:MAG: hypothetical protein ACPG7F_06885, partial [Aggregatilineales bacterium]